MLTPFWSLSPLKEPLRKHSSSRLRWAPLLAVAALSLLLNMPATWLFDGGRLLAQTNPTYVFGPEDFVRRSTKSFEVERSFRVANPGGPYTLCVDNAGVSDQYRFVTAGEIELNSKHVVAEQEFGARPATLGKAIQLKRGTNELEVEIESAVGSGFTLSIVQGNSANCPGGTANRAPNITSNPGASPSALVGQAYTYDVNANDPDNDVLTYSLTTFPSGMTVAPTSGLISWTPTAAGSVAVGVAVSDGRGGVSTQSFSLVVTQPNRPPTITSTPGAVPTVMANQLFSYDVNAIDPDNDPVTFVLVSAPVGVSLDAGTGLLAWMPTVAGSYAFAIEARDGRGGVATQSFALLVTAAAINHPPTATNDRYAVQVGQTLTVPASGLLQNDSDQDGNALSAQGLTTPSVGTLSGPNADGSFSYTAPGATGAAPFQPVVRYKARMDGGHMGHYEVDVTGDRVRDVIVKGTVGFSAFEGMSGTLLWSVAGGYGGVLPSPFTQPCRVDSGLESWAVGDIDDDGSPEIVATANCDSSVYDGADFLMAIDARTGRQKWLSQRLSIDKGTLPADVGGFVSSAYRSGVTIARLAPGEAPSILFGSSYNEDFGNCARYVESAPPGQGNYCRRVTIVDGRSGEKRRSVFSAGAAAGRRVLGDQTESQSFPPPIVFDLDRDGESEIIYAGVVFAMDGHPKWELPVGVPHVAIGNLDDTPDVEVVMVAKNYNSNRLGNLEAYKADGTLLWRYPLGNGETNLFSHLTVADVDGDGFADILFPYYDYGLTRNTLLAVGNDGRLKWIAQTPAGDGLLSARSRVSVFDLDGDGVAEVIKQEGTALYIFDGLDGSLKSTVSLGHSADLGIAMFVPSVADLDGDGRAEIVTVNAGNGDPDFGLWVVKSANDDWRRVTTGLSQMASGGLAVAVGGDVPLDAANQFADRRTNVWGTVSPEPFPSNGNSRKQASFLYAASDGTLSSAAATVTIDIAPLNRPPLFTSTPPAVYSPNGSFTYTAVAIDPDAGDTVSYRLGAIHDPDAVAIGGPGCSIEAASGLLSCGFMAYNQTKHPLVQFLVIATDDHGASTSQLVSVIPNTGAVLMPSLLGQQQTAAAAAIASAGLQLSGVLTMPSGFPAGHVISQTPTAGTPLPRDGFVSLVVSAGPPPVTVPAVVGRAQSSAEAAIVGAKLTVGQVAFSLSSAVPEGRVIGLTPAVGSTVAQGTPVNLLVSLGAGLRVVLERPLINAGSTVPFTVRVVDNSGADVLPTPVVTLTIVGSPSAGPAPTVAGTTIVTDVTTRGAFTLHAAETSGGATADTSFVVLADATTLPSAGVMSGLAASLVSTGRNLTDLARAMTANDIVALAAARTALQTTRSSLDLAKLARTPAVAPEVGFLPSPDEIAAAGYPETEADRLWHTRLKIVVDAMARVESALNADTASGDDLASLRVAVGQLQDAFEALQAVHPTPYGVVADWGGVQQVVAVQTPRIMAAAIDRIMNLLQRQGLSASVWTTPECDLAALRGCLQTPSAYYASASPTAWPLSLAETASVSFVAGIVIQQLNISFGHLIYEPASQIHGALSTLLAAHAVQTASLEVLTSRASSFHVFGVEDSIIEARGVDMAFGDWGSNTETYMIGPSAVQAVAQYLQLKMPLVKNMDDQLDMFDEVARLAKAIPNSWADSNVRADQARGGCAFDSSRDCGQLVYHSGFESVFVRPTGALYLPSTVLIIVRTAVTGHVAMRGVLFYPLP